MRHRVAICILLVSLLLPVTVRANETKQEPILIETYQSDVTGDGQNEEINLYGILFSPDTRYYRDIWANITGPEGESWKINYGGGYDPTIRFVDLNHDKINDIFYQSPTGGSGGIYTSFLHTLANKELLEIPLPEQPYVKGQFEENFTVSIELTPNGKPIVMDVKSRAEDYIRLGIYNKEGKLLTPTEIMVDPIAFFEPIKISADKGYGLKSYQQISGAYHADQLGTLETLWYYENDKWILLQTNWNPASP
ncbi:hypothetical protein [Oceanobacillus chungangensis]|uniref:Spore coat protein n=1 Tax=Oceanobacillus chungangensis TaxID=1229152 RepID=A0A3D8Q0Q4_9BACI|nr:hypothetical protein [Oceanobacillus chungangensis]RDW20999.1 hypothetical protein CWR45_03900 [Oceanobacillus chungangensis]